MLVKNGRMDTSEILYLSADFEFMHPFFLMAHSTKRRIILLQGAGFSAQNS